MLTILGSSGVSSRASWFGSLYSVFATFAMIPRSHQYINNIFCIGARARLLHGGLSTLVHLDLSSPLLHCLYLVSASFFFCGSSKPWQNRFFVKASGTGFPVKICVGASGQFYVVTFPGVSFLSLWELPSKKGTHRFACHLGDGLISWSTFF